MIVAGPADGPLDRFAARLDQTLGRALPGRPPVERRPTGGVDGVTGANQFDAFGEPDGRTALLLPGLALLAWLAGEARVQFNPARWVALWAVSGSAVLLSRTALTPGARIRIGAASPVGAELPALLALDLLGIDAVLSSPQEEDARLIRGGGVPGAISRRRAQWLPARDVPLAATLNATPLWHAIPTALELVANHAPPGLVAALHATSSAVESRGRVGPAPDDAGRSRGSLAPRLRSALPRPNPWPARWQVGVYTAPGPTTCRASPPNVADDPPAALALRDWLASRHGWRPA